jgi:predicted transglutaminase-like cysteine proteinase
MCEREPSECTETRAASDSEREAVRQWASQTRWTVTFAAINGGPAATSPTDAIPADPNIALGTAAKAEAEQDKAKQPKIAVDKVDGVDKKAARKAAARAAQAARQNQAPGSGPVYSGDIRTLTTLNRRVNRSIRRASDDAQYGRAEYWTVPQGRDATGDCEDYVLAKRRALLDAGVSPEALSIAVVRTRRGEMHAVLLVATEGGEMVLDNLSPWIVPWTEAPYEWLERQVAGSAHRWVRAAV